MVRQTLADIHRDEGRLEGLNEGRLEGELRANRRTLLDQLRLRWGDVPAETQQAIEATQDPDTLAEWLRGIITKNDLGSIGIRPLN